MKILIDTNVVLDVLTRREPHFTLSSEIFKLCASQIMGCLAVFQVRDIFYLLCKSGVSKTRAKSAIACLTDTFKVLNAELNDVNCALASEMSDFEDALLAHCAKRNNIQYIITRDKKDFSLSPVEALPPQRFIKTFFPQNRI